MILTTDELMAERRCTAKTLHQTDTDGATLSLTYDGAAPAWARYMEPVTLMHRGVPLFTGKVVRVTAGEEAGAAGTTSVEVQDFFYLLQRATLGAQLDEVRRAAGGTSALSGGARELLRNSLNTAMQSWATLAASCRMESTGWTVTAKGEPHRADDIGLNPRRAAYSFGRYMEVNRATTAADAMKNMRQANPDCLLLPNYTTGKVEVVAISKADEVVWDTQSVGIISASDIGRDYESAVAGVAVAVSYPVGEGQRVRIGLYPEELSMEDVGVRLFTASADTAAHAGDQLAFALRQAQAYYEAANEVQYTGSVVAALEDVAASPLGCRLSITGRGARPEWADMRAIVSEVEWDFTERSITATLGFEVQEPDITELQWEDSGDHGGGGGGEGGGGVDPFPPDDGGSDEDGSGSGDGGGSGAGFTAEVFKAVEPAAGGRYNMTLTAKPDPAGKYAFLWKCNGKVVRTESAVFTGLEYGTRYTFTLELTDTLTREKTTLHGDFQEDFEPLTLAVEDSVAGEEEDVFLWRLAWLPSKEVARATLEVDNGGAVAVSGAEYTARVQYGVHTARVEVVTAAGEKAAQVVTIAHLGKTEPDTPPPTDPDTPPTDPDNPPSGNSGDGSDPDAINMWVHEEVTLAGAGYDATLSAEVNTPPARMSYVWWVNGQTYTGRTVELTGLAYGTAYRYTVVAEDAGTGRQERVDGELLRTAETSVPCTVQVTAITNPALKTYEALIFILSDGGEGAKYRIELSGGATATYNDRMARLVNLRYGVDYYYTATVQLDRPNSQGLSFGESKGTIRKDAPEEPDEPPTDPDTPPTDPDNPPTDPDTPTSGNSDTPPTDPDTPTGCGCAEKMAELERRVAELEARLTGSGCDCDCAGLVEAVRAALNEAVARAVQQASQAAAAASVMAVTFSDTAVQEVEQTDTGLLRAKTTVNGVTAAGGGSASTSIGYNV